METVQKEVKRRGRPKKVLVEIPTVGAVIVNEEEGQKREEVLEPVAPKVEEKVIAKPLTDLQRKIQESRKLLEVPVPEGHKLFESPDGEIILGESSKGHVWSRTMNGGKGGYANARR